MSVRWRWSLPVLCLRWGAVVAAVGCGSPANDAPVCGDGRLNQDVEQCDGLEIRGDLTCRDYEFLRGQLGCDPTCTRILTDSCEAMAGAQSDCGNGGVDPGEECDGAVAPGLDCERLDLGVGELSCTGACELDRRQCSAYVGECGDGLCGNDETCSSCPTDCDACLECPNGVCDADESCNSCPQDCGVCKPQCSDGVCNGTESCTWCPQDCGACEPKCPDEICNGSETCLSCVLDCGACGPNCGNGVCGGDESCISCPQDCGACDPACSDGACNGSETCSNCPGDCGACPPSCGDNSCNGSETCSNCPGDCGTCPCGANNHWSPSSMVKSLAGPATLNVTFKDSGLPSSLHLQICKAGQENFTNDIHVEFEEWVKYTGAQMVYGTLSAKDKTCTANVSLDTSTWKENQGFGGDIMIVSPATCSYHWAWSCDEKPGDGCGSCWFGGTSVMKRTCK